MGSCSTATDDSGSVSDVTSRNNVEPQLQTDQKLLQQDLRRLPGAKSVRQVLFKIKFVIILVRGTII